MTAKTLVPINGFGGKAPTQTDLLAPMSIPAPKFKPLHKDLIFDAREDPMNSHDLFSFLPPYNVYDSDRPCLGATDLAGIVNKRVKDLNNIPDQFGIYPQPLPSRAKHFGLAHTRCDIENSNNKVLRSYNNFDINKPPPFKPSVLNR
tara:strand:+ start:778 stop:1218 length:441 start_codon:yes stop_codon:yes gene_type:complete